MQSCSICPPVTVWPLWLFVPLWLASTQVMSSRAIKLLQIARSSFLRLSNTPFEVYTIFFIHACTDGLLGCLHNLAVVNNAAMDMGVQRPLWEPAFSYCGWVPRSGWLGQVALLVFVLFLNHNGHIINYLYIVAFLTRPFSLNPWWWVVLSDLITTSTVRWVLH